MDPEARTLHFKGGVEESFDYLVYIPPHVVPQVVRDAGLTGDGGWASVDRNSMATGFDGVYASGT